MNPLEHKIHRELRASQLVVHPETKTIRFCIDSMRAICLLRKAFHASEAQERGFSNCTSGKEELAACDETLPGPFGRTFKQKI